MSDLAFQGKPQLHRNSFEIFGLEPRFEIDKAKLTERFHHLMHAVHPDRHVGASEAERRLAMQWSSRINEAYRELLKPLSRAKLLCEIAAGPVDLLQTTMPAAFLMQQMQWREDFEAIVHHADRVVLLDKLEAALRQTAKELAGQFAQITPALSGSNPSEPAKLAVELLRQWMFIEKFLDDIEQQRMQWLEVLPS
ncbi:MAG: Fe-S protein assembly co-chaperone HscB [Betaproteobacteria bacterium]|jgi:molecular chaperone HscB|nr:Fe-S protein assembly co-chaperone HscB [Betaproteobacteria bacterium]NBO95019.1 Fe-S protein assembly co-chaperone HscB [Betaproteobacteria bacterium]NBP35103.1 Fe-S protein assembly co-chaperone HscB [Betaproteobacteria bacterium]NBP37452.1 Fe-S protein assembly co-chaperone HscB [Betaproteobacteria bacterium]NBQ78816.1 Fe-S protein assembly co-chaperone HscB [Betaproteobacteria bacterium]